MKKSNKNPAKKGLEAESETALFSAFVDDIYYPATIQMLPDHRGKIGWSFFEDCCK